MEKVVITQFSDPMMGLSWECEPMLREIEERYGNAVEVRDYMGVLVRDVADLCFKERLGIWQLPAFLVQHGECAVLHAGAPHADDMAAAIERVLATAHPNL